MAKYIVNEEKIKEKGLKLKEVCQKKRVEVQRGDAVKSNFSEKVLKCIKQSGAEYEIVSDFEWDLVKEFQPESLVLNDPGKSVELVSEILKTVKILYFNIDNDTDFEILKQANAADLKKIKIGLRIYLPKEGIWNRFGYDILENSLKDRIKTINSISKFEAFIFYNKKYSRKK